MQSDNDQSYDFEDENKDPIDQEAKSPAMLGEEETSDSVPVDIDEELKRVGRSGDTEEEPKPLGSD